MKKIIILVICAGLSLSFVFLLRVFYIINMEDSLKPDLEYFMSSISFFYDNSNIPFFLKGVYLEGKEADIFDKLRNDYPKDIFDSNQFDNFLNKSELKKLLPTGFRAFNGNVEIYIKEKTNEKKQNELPTVKGYDNLPLPPNSKLMRNNYFYFSILSKIIEKNGDYKHSLLLSHALLYFARELESDSKYGIRPNYKILLNAYNSIACNSILYWASKPKPKQSKLCKIIAKDILDFVKNDYPISRNIIWDGYNLNYIFDYLIKKGRKPISKIKNSKAYMDYYDLFYVKPTKFCDKSLLEKKDDVDKLSKEMKKVYDSACKGSDRSLGGILSELFFPEEELLKKIIKSKPFISLSDLNSSNEKKLAKMELTAIALAINGYISETGNFPESMNTLNKWFGSDLPKNRFTNKDYELDFSGKYVIYNNGPDGKKDDSNSLEDDCYFCYFKE